jgi:mannose-6-phosphate isomerase-like protein (cupin superfamily)
MAKTPLKIDLIASAQKLAASGDSSVALFQHGDANLLLFVPQDQDKQAAHKRDEIYVIQSGHGIFKRGEETVRFDAGDVLFVPAGAPHRFANFSADFKAWVLFFGPEGGAKR